MTFFTKKTKKNDEKSTVCDIILMIGVVAGFSEKAKSFFQKWTRNSAGEVI